MSDDRQTKNQRREAAREAAREAREKAQRRQKMLKWVVPASVSAAIVAIVVVVVLVIVTAPPPPEQSQAGPQNMANGGLTFVADDAGSVEPVMTGAIPADGEPTPPEWSDEGVAHIDVYLDFSCPGCKSSDEVYGQAMLSLVESGQATISYHPVAILDTRFAGSRYSTRSANVGACVAQHAPESFIPVMHELFAQQPSQGTRGHDNNDLVSITELAGLENEEVAQCIRDEYFTPFIGSITEHTTSDEALRGPQGFATPTYAVNGQRWDGSIDLLDFIQSFIGAE